MLLELMNLSINHKKKFQKLGKALHEHEKQLIRKYYTSFCQNVQDKTHDKTYKNGTFFTMD